MAKFYGFVEEDEVTAFTTRELAEEAQREVAESISPAKIHPSSKKLKVLARTNTATFTMSRMTARFG